ncbi:hypothetical protein FEDK69T_28000 [Flavobacterium enshiense DK69]|uniref:Fibronectin type-III domain-containing protein n=1 Tax=Flavobacterium enshiense DK69 TaxID=1107311 RepID=V6S205_9FLAO|nr:fibronectin type III domain-containing protein [Flavobacterium enshiense]ESU20287.1 hypothetical protein FEDK69T_28000 [Flavobacterium enshiense DK69]KGO95900.1 hypothetical protein Q767_09475 [Flavobacterium enshiense DK69]
MKKVTFLLILVTIFGCEIEKINYVQPIAVTFEPDNVMTTSASLGGAVASEGGKNVSEYGIVWDVNPNPTTADNKAARGVRIGEFYETFLGFQPNTTYYYRFYAINEVGVGYGDEYSFKTGIEAPCNPAVNNRVNLNSYSQININNVEMSHPSWGFNEGNIEFATSSYSSTARIFVQFNENNRRAPLSGEYTTVLGDFGNDVDLSTGKAKLFIQDYGMGYGGATAVAGTKFYVKNENNVLTIIFCDTHVGDHYILNGKFSYNLN